MPVQNEALLEAYASCPPSARIYQTLEVNHPSFASPFYIVTNVGDDMSFGIEVGSDVNSGQTVAFIACPCSASYPEQREGQPPSVTVKIDNVNRELVPGIRAALGYRAYIAISYREYLGSDLTEPAYGPLNFELINVKMVGASLTGSAVVKNLQNKRFPRLTKNYDYIQFPSLLPQ